MSQDYSRDDSYPSVGNKKSKKPRRPERINPHIKYNTGKWAEGEHQLFLDAVRMYGKDWDKIEDHIKTRSISNIRSHAQKFLIRLIRFLDKEDTIDELTEEDAQFYFGILN
mmetsp:Transcript_10564/g.16149  ORF Transcript_10564/g.16149 Transcript_10564/m.16149 type:complete len:111 (+) Transcript_10564:512-844(+)